jgi:hypothetical protein
MIQNIYWVFVVFWQVVLVGIQHFTMVFYTLPKQAKRLLFLSVIFSVLVGVFLLTKSAHTQVILGDVATSTRQELTPLEKRLLENDPDFLDVRSGVVSAFDTKGATQLPWLYKDVMVDGTTRPDNANEKIEGDAESWKSLLANIEDKRLKTNIRTGVYSGPQGNGYILHLSYVKDGHVYTKQIDLGPEGRTYDWN